MNASMLIISGKGKTFHEAVGSGFARFGHVRDLPLSLDHCGCKPTKSHKRKPIIGHDRA
jgi:hypothetical protein